MLNSQTVLPNCILSRTKGLWPARILAGNGFGLAEARNAVQIVHDIRHATPLGLKGDYHPLARLEQSPHPFGW